MFALYHQPYETGSHEAITTPYYLSEEQLISLSLKQFSSAFFHHLIRLPCMLIARSKWINQSLHSLASATTLARRRKPRELDAHSTTADQVALLHNNIALIHILALFPLSTLARDLLRFHDTLAKRYMRSKETESE